MNDLQNFKIHYMERHSKPNRLILEACGGKLDDGSSIIPDIPNELIDLIFLAIDIYPERESHPLLREGIKYPGL